MITTQGLTIDRADYHTSETSRRSSVYEGKLEISRNRSSENLYHGKPQTFILKGYTLRETNIAMENGPFEAVFTIEYGGCPLLSWFTRGYKLYFIS